MTANAENLTTNTSPLYHYDELRIIHLELTHRCNAACPMCARNINGGAVNPDMPLSELSLADVKAILLPELIGRLKRIYACGNYGDPMVARDCLEVFRYLREHGPNLNLDLHTNGSARRPEWWRELAEIMKQGPHYLRFGIDGLEDTNHLYRRGADWKTVMRSAEAFIDAGGRAEWDFLVFRHNEHQVEEARKLAEDMGFKEFFVRKTGRFLDAGELETSDRFDVLDKKGNFEYVSGATEKPGLPEPGFRQSRSRQATLRRVPDLPGQGRNRLQGGGTQTQDVPVRAGLCSALLLARRGVQRIQHSRAPPVRRPAAGIRRHRGG